VTALTESLRVIAPGIFRQTGGEQEIILFGIILMVVMVFMPEGLTRSVLDLYRRRRRASRVDVPGMEPEAKALVHEQ